jgi:hypothetical protein
VGHGLVTHGTTPFSFFSGAQGKPKMQLLAHREGEQCLLLEANQMEKSCVG